MHVIDINNWNRRVIYENFIGYDNPVFSISTRLDVKKLYDYCKRNDKSFFITFLFVVAKSLNSIEEFRLRLKEGKVVLYDEVSPSFIVKRSDGVVSTCRADFINDYEAFYLEARKTQRQTENSAVPVFNGTVDNNDTFYVSCMPWVDIHSFSNPYDLKNADATSIPRVTWSKFVPEGDALRMTLDIAAHHALIDGEPVCRALNEVQRALDNIDDFLR